MGEIWVRGYCVMDGYYRNPEQTLVALGHDGWLRTGDLYIKDALGRMLFQGRLKDMLKVGGENVATMEVEAFLCSHPQVKFAEVVGRPDPRLDEVPVAFVEIRDAGAVTEEELIAFCKGRIANYKIPRAVHFMAAEEWPMSATKVDKRALPAGGAVGGIGRLAVRQSAGIDRHSILCGPATANHKPPCHLGVQGGVCDHA